VADRRAFGWPAASALVIAAIVALVAPIALNENAPHRGDIEAEAIGVVNGATATIRVTESTPTTVTSTDTITSTTTMNLASPATVISTVTPIPFTRTVSQTETLTKVGTVTATVISRVTQTKNQSPTVVVAGALFAVNSPDWADGPAAESDLLPLVRAWQKNASDWVLVKCVGRTARVGERDSAIDLSRERSDRALEMLVTLGMAPKFPAISIGLGYEHPLPGVNDDAAEQRSVICSLEPVE
jgi:outer membrane protein OmpA-like peptidoglycan-associated protein